MKLHKLNQGRPLPSMTGLGLGAAFLMANSSIGPGFLTQTSFYTEQLLTSFGFVILISIILSHARMLNIKYNMAPVLLLDDIVEHLDEKHKTALFLEISRHCAQSWFTSTSKEAFKNYPKKIDST